MSEKNIPQEIQDDREISRIGLMEYMDDVILNRLDKSTEDLIKDLNEKMKKKYKDAKHSNSEAEKYYCLLDAEYIEDQLIAIYEMKIIHLYKSLEINIKKMISAAYQKNTNDFFRWESLTFYLDSKEINYKEMAGYNEVEELRKVNNSLKHSIEKGSSKINHIKEFSNKKNIHFDDLSLFYNRVKIYPIQWLTELRNLIYKELYTFNHNRLDTIALSYAKRMDEKTMKNFIAVLKAKY